MADRGDTHYRVSHLNQWFLWSSLLLLLSFVWMVLDDHRRPWKEHQREFRRVEIAQTEAEKQALEGSGALATEAELKAKVAEAQATVATRQSELDQAAEDERLRRGVLWSAIEEAKKAKSQYNWDRWGIEVERLERGDPALDAAEIAATELWVNQAASAQEAAQLAHDETKARVGTLTGELDQAEDELAAVLAHEIEHIDHYHCVDRYRARRAMSQSRPRDPHQRSQVRTFEMPPRTPFGQGPRKATLRPTPCRRR